MRVLRTVGCDCGYGIRYEDWAKKDGKSEKQNEIECLRRMATKCLICQLKDHRCGGC